MTEIFLHTHEDFIGMRKAGALAARVLDFIEPFVESGIQTEHLNQLCHDYIVGEGAIPAPLNYQGFPKSVCISVNEVVCHGIPGNKILKKGDIVNIDVTVIVDGWHGDASRMYTIEPISTLARRLIDVTYFALDQAIACVKPGCFLGDIGHAIQSIAEKNGFSVVRDFCGHGIGKLFHASPQVCHFGKPGTGIQLKEGMFLTIEPMINAGKPDVRILSDGWTAITRDRSLSAQKEHTLGVTAHGVEIFTQNN